MPTTNKDEAVVLRQAAFKGSTVTLGQPARLPLQSEVAEHIQHKTIVDVPESLVSADTSKVGNENAVKAEQVLLSELREQARVENQKILEAEKARLKKQYDQQMTLLQKQFDTQVASLNTVIQDLQKKSLDFHALLEPAVIRIVQYSLEKILGDISSQEELIVMLIKQAISQHNIDDGFVLKVSVADYELMNKLIRQNSSIHNDKIEVQQDSSLKSGQCLIDLSRSIIDISPSLQVQKVGQLLNDQ